MSSTPPRALVLCPCHAGQRHWQTTRQHARHARCGRPSPPKLTCWPSRGRCSTTSAPLLEAPKAVP
eukprot:4717334-Alexandrium_andersonii.AAC.1